MGVYIGGDMLGLQKNKSDSSRNDQQYTLICTTPLFYVLAPTCFSSMLPSSGSFLDPSELLEIQIEWVMYHIMCVIQVTQKDLRGSLMKAGYCRNM
jgi:hypothetical protein